MTAMIKRNLPAIGAALPWVLILLFVSAVVTSAMAQRAPGQKPGPDNALLRAAAEEQQRARLKTPAQPQQIEQQKGGDYPDFNRSTLPLGAINKNWAEGCGPESTTIAVAHRLDSELRFRVRQLLGTVVTFPETVSVVTAPGGTAFSAEPHGGDGTASNVWVFGTTQAGLDGNYVFVGSGRKAVPTMYLMRVQSEGYNTENCPDLLVLVKPATSPALANAATAMQEWAASMGARAMAEQAAAPLMPAAGKTPAASASGSDADLAGRADVDWLQGRGFDPANLDFRWTVRGDAELAPDIVYSDCCFTYLQYAPERADKVRIAAVHAVERTGSGAIDAPVNWSMKGNTIVVQGIQKLTLEREGIVTCIDPGDALMAGPSDAVSDAPESAPRNVVTTEPLPATDGAN
jgi:hypothetical protein